MRTKNPDKMKEIVEYINKQYFEYNLIPTVQEIAKAVKMVPSNVQNYLYEMQERGMITMDGGWRGLKTNLIAKDCNIKSKAPILGKIACGEPLFAEENIEGYITISAELLGQGKFFALWANGDSMIKAGIKEGDLVLVRQQNYAEEGQIVVALCDGENATLKRYYTDKKNKRFRLHPENDNMQDMYYKDVEIQGVAVKVLSNLV